MNEWIDLEEGKLFLTVEYQLILIENVGKVRQSSRLLKLVGSSLIRKKIFK